MVIAMDRFFYAILARKKDYFSCLPFSTVFSILETDDIVYVILHYKDVKK